MQTLPLNLMGRAQLSHFFIAFLANYGPIQERLLKSPHTSIGASVSFRWMVCAAARMLGTDLCSAIPSSHTAPESSLFPALHPHKHTLLGTHLINHVNFQGFYLQSYTVHSVHFDQFFFLPHDITWSTWSHKRFTGRLHAPNHTACIMQVSWRCGIFKTPFSFCSLLSSFPLSSLRLTNLNPPAPSLLPLTYKFLIENPLSLYLFLDSPFTPLLHFLR